MIKILVDLMHDWLVNTGLYSVLQVFNWITFRAIAALILSFALVVAFGPRTIRWLIKQKIGDAPEFNHADLNRLTKHKANTPTMGGVLIAGAIFTSLLLLADIRTFYIQMAMLCLVWLSVLGGFDDWLKLTSARRNPGSRHGLFMWEKLVFQVGIALLLGLFIHFHGSNNPPTHLLNLPFQRTFQPGTMIYEEGLIYLGPWAFGILAVIIITGSEKFFAAGADIAERPQHALLEPGCLACPGIEPLRHLPALQTILGAAKVAGDDWAVQGCAQPCEVRLRAGDEGAQHVHIARIIGQPRRHRRQSPAMGQVEHEGRQRILAMMAEHDRRAPLFARDAVEMPPAQSRAKCAIGAARTGLFLDDGIGVARLDPVGHAQRGEPAGQDLARESRLALVEVAGQKVDRKPALRAEIEQNGEEGMAVLAAGEADEPARPGAFGAAGWHHLPGLDHPYGFAGQSAAQALKGRFRGRAGKQRAGGFAQRVIVSGGRLHGLPIAQD